MNYLIGLDVGTSSVKAALVDAGGNLLARAGFPVELYTPTPGWAEQDPQAWWQAACRALRQIVQALPTGERAVIGLAGQCPGHVLVDRSQRALGRAIIWRDQRAQAEAAWLNEHVTPEQAQAALGTPSIGEATSPLARLLWLKNHRRTDWDSAVGVLQPKDYLALRLTGQMTTDRYSAYCQANAGSGEYPRELFERLGIDLAKLPRTLLPTEIAGEITPAGSQETGVAPGTPVVTGTIDAYCDTLAGGVACPGRCVDVAGTSETVSLHIDRPATADGVYSGRIGDQLVFFCGPTQAGGDTLRWLTRAFLAQGAGEIDFARLEAEAASAPAGCDGMVFLPYLNGERTPIWDATARGCFYGLTFTHERRHFTRAVYEGVGYAVRHVLEKSEAGSGAQAEKIVICGGGSRSRLWNQVKADVLQRDVVPAEIGETGCLGAALLAAVGTGVYADLEAASAAMVRLGSPIHPEPANRQVYEAGYQVYRQLYPALKPLAAPNAGLDSVKGAEHE